MAPRRVLLTGGTGFIGRALLPRLVEAGWEVVALHGRAEPGPDRPGVTWRRADLLAAGPAELRRLAEEAGAGHCLHAAWYTHHADYLVHAVNRDWLAASLRLAEGFRQAGGRRFVGLGTCIEYAPPADGPCVEDETPLAPDTLYARCKRDLYEALEARGGDFAWARIFFVYGPGDRGGRLVPFVLDRFARGEEAGPTYGGLRRDYIHVDDLAGQLARILASDVRGAINTGTGAAVPVAEVFSTAARLFGRPDLARLNDALADGQPPLIEAGLDKHRLCVGPPETRTLEAGLAPLVAEAARGRA
jgi:nucleoside-diphosphate-sugar epimerase